MDLKEAEQNLRTVAESAKALSEQFKTLAASNSDVTKQQQDKLAEMIAQTESGKIALREAATVVRNKRISELTKSISGYDSALATPGLTPETRDDIKSKLDAALAERAQLNAQAGTDFGGLLTLQEAQNLDRLLDEAKAEVAAKKQAKALVAVAEKVAETSLFIAKKVALA